MASELEVEVYRQLRASQDKFSYFFLASIGASIGFVLNQTKEMPISFTQSPLAFSLLCWGLSFYFGCLHLQYVNSNLFANFELIRVQSGKNPNVGSHQQIIGAASEGIRDAIKDNDKMISRYSTWQFRLFITGVFTYIVWHVLEMYLRAV